VLSRPEFDYPVLDFGGAQKQMCVTDWNIHCNENAIQIPELNSSLFLSIWCVGTLAIGVTSLLHAYI
jgi:hypothetical protein